MSVLDHRTPVLKSIFSSEYCEILRVPILKNICKRMLHETEKD